MKTELKPGESVEVPIELTPDAIRALNSGKAIKMQVKIEIPWLSSPWVKYPVVFLASLGLVTIISVLVETVLGICK